MAESIVKTPSTAEQDFDFLAFSFNGKHSWDDFGLYRVSSGNRYNTELSPQMNDITAENPSADGMYFFNSFHKQKVFNINFAFEEINDVTLRSLKQWLNGKEQGDLWFEEEPYKVYTAKVTGTPSIKHIPFDKYVGDTKTRVYRGEGTVQFTCYWPYAHTPDWIKLETFNIKVGQVLRIGDGDGSLSSRYFYIDGVSNANKIIQLRYNTKDDSTWRWSTLANSDEADSQMIDLGKVGDVINIKATQDVSIKIYKASGTNGSGSKTLVYRLYNGRDLDSYSSFFNKSLWADASGLTSSTGACTGENPGDLLASFILSKSGTTSANTTFTITDKLYIKTLSEVHSLKWDSKTGIVSGLSSAIAAESTRAPVLIEGNTVGGIPVGGCSPTINGATLTYHYWYY